LPIDPTPAVAIDGNTVTVTLPEGDQTVVPTIPEELRDHEIPAFVIEWIMESDEIATLVQGLVQAPTRSLCRAMVAPKPTTDALKPPSFDILGKGAFRSPTPPLLNKSADSVKGFEAGEPPFVQGLPEGVKIPIEVMDVIAMARKVDAWMWKGMRVTEWAMENGAADASWLPAAD
jgi:hypothetical protein